MQVNFVKIRYVPLSFVPSLYVTFRNITMPVVKVVHTRTKKALFDFLANRKSTRSYLIFQPFCLFFHMRNCLRIDIFSADRNTLTKYTDKQIR